MQKKIFLMAVFLFCISMIFSEEMKVANYSIGEPDTDSYEEFSFWIKASKKIEIIYRYGKWKDQKDLTLAYLGTLFFKDDKCFKVRFSNNYELYIIPDGIKLKVVDKDMKYNKIFLWKYDGPVDGRGTFCSICAHDETEAINLINEYFMN